MKRVLSFARSRFPFIFAFRRFVINAFWNLQSPANKFTTIYRENRWKDPASRSGPGSNLSQTAAIRQALPLAVGALDCTSLLDIPCGDFHWMSQIDWDIEYTGADIVADLIRANQLRYGRADRSFIQLNIISDRLPQVDLIFCRDCLVHFSNAHIFDAIKNMKSSGSRYLLTTTFTNRSSNENIGTGAWRPINLQRPPFNFPAPLQLIDEKCTEANGAFSDKALGLWRMDDLPG